MVCGMVWYGMCSILNMIVYKYIMVCALVLSFKWKGDAINVWFYSHGDVMESVSVTLYSGKMIWQLSFILDWLNLNVNSLLSYYVKVDL